jgi:photosystem II stability/assembly factor-like uncharacterized protein
VRVSGGIAAAAIALSIARPASANGRYPAASQIVVSSTGPLVVRTTYGLLVTRDDGATWSWICEGAMGVPAASAEDPSVALTSGGLVVGLAEGLETSADLGCNFACAGGALAGRAIVDLATRPDAPRAVVALSSSYVFDDAGRASSDTRIWRSEDDGAHWVELGAPLDGAVTVSTIDLAPGDPQRLYVSGTRGYGAALVASLFVSNDEGATWTERPVPIDPSREFGIYIAAVDPSSADRVYLRSTGAARLYVTDNAGASFRSLLALVGPMNGFALSADGTSIYAGGPEDGLFAARGGAAFQKVSGLPVECLAARGPSLWACADPSSGFEVGVSVDGGAFAPRVVPAGIPPAVQCTPSPSGPFACGAGANASQCLARPADAGLPLSDSGTVESFTPGAAGCGCAEAGSGRGAGAGLVTFILAAGLGGRWGIRRRGPARKPARRRRRSD